MDCRVGGRTNPGFLDSKRRLSTLAKHRLGADADPEGSEIDLETLLLIRSLKGPESTGEPAQRLPRSPGHREGPCASPKQPCRFIRRVFGVRSELSEDALGRWDGGQALVVLGSPGLEEGRLGNWADLLGEWCNRTQN